MTLLTARIYCYGFNPRRQAKTASLFVNLLTMTSMSNARRMWSGAAHVIGNLEYDIFCDAITVLRAIEHKSAELGLHVSKTTLLENCCENPRC